MPESQRAEQASTATVAAAPDEWPYAQPVALESSRAPATCSPAVVLLSAGATFALGAAIWFAHVLRPDPAVMHVALFVHLGSLVLGFGAVLVADYLFALWLVGRIEFADAVASSSHLHLPVWAGLIGLMASGALLQPNLSSPVTLLKMALVAILTVNGVQVLVLGQRMAATGGIPSRQLLMRGTVSTAVSQLCWWGAIIIGFRTSTR